MKSTKYCLLFCLFNLALNAGNFFDICGNSLENDCYDKQPTYSEIIEKTGSGFSEYLAPEDIGFSTQEISLIKVKHSLSSWDSKFYFVGIKFHTTCEDGGDCLIDTAYFPGKMNSFIWKCNGDSCNRLMHPSNEFQTRCNNISKKIITSFVNKKKD